VWLLWNDSPRAGETREERQEGKKELEKAGKTIRHASSHDVVPGRKERAGKKKRENHASALAGVFWSDRRGGVLGGAASIQLCI